MERPWNLRGGEAEKYFCKRMGENIFTYRIVVDPEGNSFCLRCGRHVGKGQKICVIHSHEAGETLKYGVSCWPDQMLMELRKAIRIERDAARKARMVVNLEKFCSTVEDQGHWSGGYIDLKKRVSQPRPGAGSRTTEPRKRISYVVTDVFNKLVRTFTFQQKEDAIKFAEAMEARGRGKHSVRQAHEPVS
jgi:hypothetical protein